SRSSSRRAERGLPRTRAARRPVGTARNASDTRNRGGAPMRAATLPSMTVEPPRFGVLQRVPASSATGWTHEAHDFTPWLADNLGLLGQELGLALEVVGREHGVGRYWLDLLLSDATGRVVIVENQFGQTDHDHLGKLLT